MYDQYRVTRSIADEVLVSPDFTPDQAVNTMGVIGPDSADRLVVLFPPWHGGGKAYKHLANRLVSTGSAVLDLSFDDHILNPNVDEVLKSYDVIENKVASRLDVLVSDRNFKRVDAFGSSLGNVALAVVARSFDRFTNTTMVVPGSNLARSMWEGARTQRLRGHFEEQGLTEDDLEAAWHDIAPITNAKAFRGSSIDVFVSSKDRIIPTDYQKEMANALFTAGADVKSHTSRLGHYLSVAASCYIRKLP